MSRVVETLTATETPTTSALGKPPQLDLPWSEPDQALFSQASAAAHEVRGAARRRQPSPALAEEEAARRPVVRALLTYPTVFVQVPRAVAAHYGQQPWAEVRRAAEQGLDGLVLLTDRPREWCGREGEPAPRVPDVAFLAEGQDEWRGRTVLYQQNW